MKAGLRASVFVLAVPLAVWALSSETRDRLDERWSRGLRREFEIHGFRDDGRALARYSLGTLCSDQRRAVRTPPCRPYNRATMTMTAALVTTATGLLTMAGLLVGGLAARRKRPTLALVFRPVLCATVAAAVLLLAGQGWLGLQFVLLSGPTLGVPTPSVLLSFTAAAVLAVGVAAAQAVTVARRVWSPPWLFARAVPGGQGAGIVQASASAGLGQDVRVVAGLAPAIFLSGSGARTVDGRLDGLVLHVSLSLGRILSRAEFIALVSAELSGLDKQGGLRDRRFLDSWSRLHQERARLRRLPGLRRLLSLPLLWLLDFLVDTHREAVSRLWAGREADSDIRAAQAAGCCEYGVALLKNGAFSPAWEGVLGAMEQAAASGEQYVNASLLFAETVWAGARREHLMAVLDAGPRPLRRRLERLGLDPTSLVDVALELRPAVPGIDMIEGATALEEFLTTGRHLAVAQASSL